MNTRKNAMAVFRKSVNIMQYSPIPVRKKIVLASIIIHTSLYNA